MNTAHVVGWLLVGGAVGFGIGAGNPYLMRVWTAPQDGFLRVVASHPQAWRFTTAFFVVSCGITAATHTTEGLWTIALIWVGHVTVTGAELFLSAAMWTFQADLMDPRRRGEYQGVGDVFNKLGFLWAPALYTFLAMEWGATGWALIALISVVAAAGMRLAVGRASRFADTHFPQQEALAA